MNIESKSRKVFNVVNILIMFLIMAIVLLPYLHIFAKSLNEASDTARGGITIFPREFTLNNYKTIISDSGFFHAFGLSVSIVVIATIVSLTVQFLAAYAFIHKGLVGRGPLLMFLMIPMYFSGGLIPTYIMYSNIGMLNNYLVYILPGCFSLYNMIIIRSYMNSLPYSLVEAANLDGASHLQILCKIIVPLSKPIMATIALWTAVGKWSDWTTSLYFVTNKDLFPLQYVLVRVLKESAAIQAMINDALMRGQASNVNVSVTPEALQSAQLIITTIPVVIIYPFLQKYFIKGVMLGAIKD